MPEALRSSFFVALAFVKTRRQLVVESLALREIVQAFPWESAPRYQLRDRDGIYGVVFRDRLRHLGIKEVTIARRSPWRKDSLIAPPRRSPAHGAESPCRWSA